MKIMAFLAMGLVLNGAALASGAAELAPVACTYFAMKDLPANAAQPMLCGSTGVGGNQYVDQALVDPRAVHHFHLDVPKAIGFPAAEAPYYYFVLYPTVAENNHADVTVLGTFRLPRMDPTGAPPMLAPTKKPYPIVVLSHGYNVHPLYDVSGMISLARHGYVVICIFHGDGRFAVSPLGPAVAKLRAKSVTAAVDDVLKDPSFKSAVDGARFGVFGISRGGNTAARLAGAVSSDGDAPCTDPRIAAIFGESPAFDEFDPFQDLDMSHVRVPVFAIDGDQDQLPPLINRVLRNKPGFAMMVSLPGQGHVPTDQTKDAVIAPWAIDFFQAFLAGNADAWRALHFRNSIPGKIKNEVSWRRTNETPAAK